MKIDHTNLSRTVSHALRHEPGAYGLTLDAQGWVGIADLLRALRDTNAEWEGVSEADIGEMVRRSSKVRHEIEGDRIRALYVPAAGGPGRPPIPTVGWRAGSRPWETFRKNDAAFRNGDLAALRAARGMNRGPRCIAH